MSIKQASKYRTNFDLSTPHITTTDFGQLQVTNFLPVVPNDKFNINVFSEARCAPMVVPTFMDVELVHRCFYVPMSAIYPAFESFYLKRPDGGALTIPYITNLELCIFITTESNGLSRKVGVYGDNFEGDFVFAGNIYLYTEKGRLFLKVLHSLGYGINFAADETQLSLLPLLAYMRVLYDYIYPSQYLDALQLPKYFKVFDSNALNTLFGTQNAKFAFLNSLIGLFALPYRQDYFTAAWKSLNAPGTQHNPQFLTHEGNTFEVSNLDTKYLPAFEEYQTEHRPQINQVALDFLSRLYDFVTRNNIVGNRFADRIFAKFGIGSRNSDPDMSQFIGQHIQPLRIADVTAMSSSEGQDLGDLAGKMFSQGNGNLGKLDSIDEFGYILTLTFVQPKVGYYQGRRRWVTCNGQFDFFQPEFDMQMRAIRNDELFADYIDAADYGRGQEYGGNPSKVFAFAPNYSEYKKGDAYLTGDFRVKTLRRNMDAYHLFRDIPTPSESSPLALNSQFLFMQQHEFDKIFAQMYSLRVPLQWSIMPFHYYSNPDTYVFIVNSKPLLIKYPNPNGQSTQYFQIYGNQEGSDFFIKVRESVDPYNEGRTEDDFYIVTASYVSAVSKAEFTLFSETFRFNLPSGTSAPIVIYHGDSSTALSFDDFMAFFRDYIDHIYLYLNFDIKATRNMAPISEEFNIHDGGNRLSVDMNGNRIV